jgi:hypothetical protein
MLTLILVSLGALIVITELLWRRTSQFLIYQGESRIRRGRSLAHVASEHYSQKVTGGWSGIVYHT